MKHNIYAHKSTTQPFSQLTKMPPHLKLRVTGYLCVYSSVDQTRINSGQHGYVGGATSVLALLLLA